MHRGTKVSEWLLSLVATAAIVGSLVIIDPRLWHWMVIPTALCGVLIGVDAARWALRRYDALDPRGLVGLFGYHFFFLVPLLHVRWDYQPKYVVPPQDWLGSLGVVATINLVGLLVYRFGLSLRLPSGRAPRRKVDAAAFVQWAWVAVAFSLAGWVALVLSHGGITGYWRVLSQDRARLDDTGYLLIIGEAWPLLAFAAILVARASWLRQHVVVLGLLLVAFVVAQFLTGGLRGSRSNTIWPTLIALGMVHHLVLPLRRRILAAGVAVLVGFMFFYGLYKSAGTDVASVLRGEGSAAAMAQETGRTLDAVILEDFGRAGIQAVVVDRRRSGVAPPPALGKGYVGDVVKLLPDPWVGPVTDKVALGAATLHGDPTLSAGLRSSRIYGLAGEGMLNFGLYGAALPFIVWTVAVRKVAAVHQRARNETGLGPKLLAPGLSIAVILMLGSDLDNLVWFLAKQVLPMAAVVLIASRALPAARALSRGPRPAAGASRRPARDGPGRAPALP